MDTLSKSERSKLMARVRSFGNKTTEILIIRLFREHRIKGWRRRRKLLGNPDFLFPRQKLAVFIDGCFWHGCPRCYRRPNSNKLYWDSKRLRNRRRDRFVARELRRSGWSVLRIWEHNLKRCPRACIKRINFALAKHRIHDAKN
jgi:DNA mismatch endonuclease (patch repair protein)